MASTIALQPIERIGSWSEFDKQSQEGGGFDKSAKRIVQEKIVLSKEEEKVLTPDYWYKLYPTGFRIRQEIVEFFQCTIPLIRQAYLSVKKKGAHIDIVNLLEDNDSRNMLLQLTFCIKIINDFSLGMAEQSLFWTKMYQQITGGDQVGENKSAGKPNVSIEPSVGDQKSSGKLEVLDKSKMDPISIKVYDTLVILKEILAIMGIYPQLSDRNKSNNKSAELMCLVADGVSRFRSVTRRNDKALTEILDSVYKLFAVDSEEYKLGLAADKVRYDRTEVMERHLDNSIFGITAGCEKSYGLKFDKVSEVIYWFPHF
ncbi:hypothetical protein ACHQM5_004062 [Ranunculus cassubicifolius]